MGVKENVCKSLIHSTISHNNILFIETTKDYCLKEDEDSEDLNRAFMVILAVFVQGHMMDIEVIEVTSCLRVSIAMIKHYGQKQPGKEIIDFIFQLGSPPSREVNARTQGRVYEGLCLLTYLLTACSACFHIAPRTVAQSCHHPH